MPPCCGLMDMWREVVWRCKRTIWGAVLFRLDGQLCQLIPDGEIFVNICFLGRWAMRAQEMGYKGG